MQEEHIAELIALQGVPLPIWAAIDPPAFLLAVWLRAQPSIADSVRVHLLPRCSVLYTFYTSLFFLLLFPLLALFLSLPPPSSFIIFKWALTPNPKKIIYVSSSI